MRLALVLVVSLGLSGCSLFESDDLVNSEPGGLLHTDQTVYDAQLLTNERSRVVVKIPFETRNTTNRPLHLIGCITLPPAVLEKRIGDAWEIVYSQGMQYCLSPPWNIASGETRQDTLRVVGYLPGQNTSPTFGADIEGTYRLRRVLFYSDLRDASEPLGHKAVPEDLSVSNTFELR